MVQYFVIFEVNLCSRIFIIKPVCTLPAQFSVQINGLLKKIDVEMDDVRF